MASTDQVTYKRALEEAEYDLKHDFESGARQMADKSLVLLKTIIAHAAEGTSTKEGFWDSIVGASRALSAARPSMRCVCVWVCARCAMRRIL